MVFATFPVLSACTQEHALGMRAATAHKWLKVFVSREFDRFISDDRDGRGFDSFWNRFPDLELEIIRFVMEQCSKKESSFTTEIFANLIDTQFYEMNGIKKDDQGLVRSA